MKEHYKGLGHIGIYTEDLEKSIAFYEKIGAKYLQNSSVMKADGERKLVMMEFAGFLIELIQPAGEVPNGEGSIAHFAVYVDDLDAAAADLKKLGVDTFLTAEKNVQPGVFGGCDNWFFKGPSGEIIELLKMYDK